MKCPKCGYNSFDHLDNCKKCNTDLSEHKGKFSLRGFFSPGQATAAPTVADNDIDETAPEDSGTVDFGFDFLEEDESLGEAVSGNDAGVNIDQPFSVDSESVPGDGVGGDDSDKPGKGPEFAF